MLTKAQIQRLAQRNGVGMQVQERDYVQHLILWLLYSRSQALIFKGGTALRLVYGGNRYSEDLDFNGPDDVAMLHSLWKGIVTGLGDFGVVAEMRNDWISDVGYASTSVSKGRSTTSKIAARERCGLMSIGGQSRCRHAANW